MSPSLNAPPPLVKTKWSVRSIMTSVTYQKMLLKNNK